MSDGGAQPAAVVVVTAREQPVARHLIDGHPCCDLETVQRVFRLVLEARRQGWRAELTEVRADLRELVELVGVPGLLDDDAGLLDDDAGLLDSETGLLADDAE